MFFFRKIIWGYYFSFCRRTENCSEELSTRHLILSYYVSYDSQRRINQVPYKVSEFFNYIIIYRSVPSKLNMRTSHMFSLLARCLSSEIFVLHKNCTIMVMIEQEISDGINTIQTNRKHSDVFSIHEYLEKEWKIPTSQRK